MYSVSSSGKVMDPAISPVTVTNVPGGTVAGSRNSFCRATNRPWDLLRSVVGRSEESNGNCRISILVPSLSLLASNTLPPNVAGCPLYDSGDAFTCI